jgi:hypothetical protein
MGYIASDVGKICGDQSQRVWTEMIAECFNAYSDPCIEGLSPNSRNADYSPRHSAGCADLRKREGQKNYTISSFIYLLTVRLMTSVEHIT